MLKTQKEEYSESNIQLKYCNTFEMMNNVDDFFYYLQGTVCPIVLNYNFNKKNRIAYKSVFRFVFFFVSQMSIFVQFF